MESKETRTSIRSRGQRLRLALLGWAAQRVSKRLRNGSIKTAQKRDEAVRLLALLNAFCRSLIDE